MPEVTTEVKGEAFNPYILVEAEIVHLLSVAKIEAIQTPAALADPSTTKFLNFETNIDSELLIEIPNTLAEDIPASFLQRLLI